MLLPDNIKPELTVYYNGAIILEELKEIPKIDIMKLYQKVKVRNEISFFTLLLSIDWLYMIDLAIINKNGEVELCS